MNLDVDTLIAAHRALRDRAARYRSSEVFLLRKRQSEANPGNVFLSGCVVRDTAYAQGLDAAADNLAEMVNAAAGDSLRCRVPSCRNFGDPGFGDPRCGGLPCPDYHGGQVVPDTGAPVTTLAAIS